MPRYLRLRDIDPTKAGVDTIMDYLTLHVTAIQFMSVLLAIAVAVTQLANWRARHHPN